MVDFTIETKYSSISSIFLGVYEPRGRRNPSRLPSARVVSISNIADVDRPEEGLTLAVMQWGQFIDHDLTHVPIFRFGEETCLSLDTIKTIFQKYLLNYFIFNLIVTINFLFRCSKKKLFQKNVFSYFHYLI